MKVLVVLAVAVFAIVGFVVVSKIIEEENTIVHESMPVGSTIESFNLVDTNGVERSFNDLKGKNGAVIVFVSAQCPVVKQYNERISEFAADFAAKGINVVGINSNYSESPEWVRSHAAEKYKFPVLIDKGNVLADKLGANVTPEIFYFDEKNVLVYHGAIDNSRGGDDITENYLRNAVEEVLSGKPVAKQTANAIGCSIKRA